MKCYVNVIILACLICKTLSILDKEIKRTSQLRLLLKNDISVCTSESEPIKQIDKIHHAFIKMMVKHKSLSYLYFTFVSNSNSNSNS